MLDPGQNNDPFKPAPDDCIAGDVWRRTLKYMLDGMSGSTPD